MLAEVYLARATDDSGHVIPLPRGYVVTLGPTSKHWADVHAELEHVQGRIAQSTQRKWNGKLRWFTIRREP